MAQENPRISEVDKPTPVSIYSNGHYWVGVAKPGRTRGTTDLHLAHEYADGLSMKEIRTYASGILGIVQSNDFDRKHPQHTGVDVSSRSDYFAIANSAAVDISQRVLNSKGQNHHPIEKPLSSFSPSTIEETLCMPHESETLQWQDEVLPNITKAGGVQDILTYKGLGPNQLLRLKTTELPFQGFSADKTAKNLLIQGAFAEEVAPRIEAAHLNFDDIIDGILTGSQKGEPTRDVIQRISGIKLGNIFSQFR